jgi:hypothetical protein
VLRFGSPQGRRLSMMWVITSVIGGFICMLTIFRFLLWIGVAIWINWLLLSMILDSSCDNSLIFNASQTQFLLNSRMIMSEEVSSDVILGGDSVQLSDVLKNLGLYVDARFSWKRQVSYMISSTFSILRLLCRVHIPSLTGNECRRLKFAFNACTVFGILIIFLSFQGRFYTQNSFK